MRTRHRIWTRFLLLTLALAGALSLTACNTVEGVGEDIQNASRNTRDALTGDGR